MNTDDLYEALVAERFAPAPRRVTEPPAANKDAGWDERPALDLAWVREERKEAS